MAPVTAPLNGKRITDIIFYCGLLTIQFVGITVKAADAINTAWILLLFPSYIVIIVASVEFLFRLFSDRSVFNRYRGWVTAGLFVAWLLFIAAFICLVVILEDDAVDNDIHIFFAVLGTSALVVFFSFSAVIVRLFSHGWTVALSEFTGGGHSAVYDSSTKEYVSSTGGSGTVSSESNAGLM